MITKKEVVEYYDEIYGKKGVNAMRPYNYYKQAFKYLGEVGTKQQDLKEELMSYDQWKDFFKKYDLRVENVRHDPWPWQSIKLFEHKNPWRIARRLAYRLMWVFAPLRSTYQFVFILNK